MILSAGPQFTVDPAELAAPPAAAGAALASAPNRTLRDCERRCILDALQLTQGMVGGPRGAAEILDVKRTTLIGKMEKLGIPRRHGTPAARSAEIPAAPDLAR